MIRQRPPKKTDSLEVRLPHEAKQAFMSRARDEGRTASEVLRVFVESYVAATETSEARAMVSRFLKLTLAATVAATVLALYALAPTAEAAASELEAMFAAIDRDQDGALSREEFVRRRGAGIVLLRHGDHLTASREADPQFTVPFDPGSPWRPALSDLADMLGEAFDEQDGDRNGVVTFGEFETHHLAIYRQAFDQTDVDKDGGIEPVEYDQAVRRLSPAQAEAAAPFGGIDKDGDGRIVWREYRG